MSSLQKLRDARTLEDIANMLGFQPSSLAYILYKMSAAQKYTHFEIPKRSGGTRCIRAPAPQLRKLQRRLANVLYQCLADIERSAAGQRSLAHGFARERSIVTNASVHKRRRYVLNLDIQDFFPSFNFGRVRGFFIKDKHFSLAEKVATLIAQIACHDNELPQGSPCSPIISNLIGHVLDVRLARLAKEHKCTYSRYADDITFSTNNKEFPPELAAPAPESSQWQLGAQLVAKIEKCGFRVNGKKTRMQIRSSRQVITGLVVNKKVNIRQDYYRIARAMCHMLFATGTCYRVAQPTEAESTSANEPVMTTIVRLGELEGILAHIYYVKYYVKDRTARREDLERFKHPSAKALYYKFLFYKNFAASQVALIVPEGKTDAIYLRTAIKKLTVYHPRLGQVINGTFSTSVRFMNCTRTVHDVLKLGNGTGSFPDFIVNYKRKIKVYGHAPLEHPVILVIDNDDGAKNVFKVLKDNGVPSISYASKDPFYKVWANLYLVKTPESDSDSKSCIEDLFDPELLKTVIDGKTFDPHKEHGADGNMAS